MFFHIDESGNTGNNLFDENQPRFSYGLISSTTNVDALCIREHQAIQKIIDCDVIHANVLGMARLVKIAPLLIKIQKKIKFDFDYYYIEKHDYALARFFESVFDASLNNDVQGHLYWTHLRYILILKLSVLFDKDLLRDSWKLAISKKIKKQEDEIVALLTEVKKRAGQSILDARSKEVIIDALNFGINNPLALDFGCNNPIIISPNAIAFQFVVTAIARRARKKHIKSISSIVVDRQTQFNKSQVDTHYHFSMMSEAINKSSPKERQRYLNQPLYADCEPEDITNKGLTDRKITVSESADSIGLQIVDVYLWIANKRISGVQLPPELMKLVSLFGRRMLEEGISLKGMVKRFEKFERELPKLEDITDEQIQLFRNYMSKKQ